MVTYNLTLLDENLATNIPTDIATYIPTDIGGQKVTAATSNALKVTIF